VFHRDIEETQVTQIQILTVLKAPLHICDDFSMKIVLFIFQDNLTSYHEELCMTCEEKFNSKLKGCVETLKNGYREYRD
jgi:hypothetical protein